MVPSPLKVRDRRLFEILRKRGPLRATDAIIAMREAGYTKRQAIAALYSLEKMGKAVRVEKGRVSIWATKEDEVRAKRLLSDLTGAKYISSDARKIHSDELKERVLELWISQLPHVSVLDGVLSGTKFIPPLPYAGEKLSVEEHPLFEDFKRHICFSPDPFEKLDELKRLAREYWERRRGLWSKIAERVEEVLNLKIGHGVTEWVPTRVLWVSLLHAKGDPRLEEYADPSLEEELKMGHVVYTHPKLRAYTLFSTSRPEAGLEDLKSKLQRGFGTLLNEAKAGKYLDEAKKLVELTSRIEATLSELRTVLEKHKWVPILPGDCEFLEASV